MLKFLNDIKNSLKNGNYYTALALTLILPDVCIHSRQLNGRIEYANWVNNNIFNDLNTFIFAKFRDDELIAIGSSKEEFVTEEKRLLPNESLVQTYSINGELMYALRCSYLHQGIINLKFGKQIINVNLKLGILESAMEVSSHFNLGINANKEVYVKIDVPWFCSEVCKKVECYYENHKKDFNDLLLIDNLETY